MATARIGFIGTGTMGAPMATWLVRAGHDVVAFDRSAGALAAVVAAGATAADSAAGAAAGTSTVFMSLPAPEDVASTVTGRGGALEADPRPERIVDLSTSSLTMVRRLRDACASAGVVFVDAPVSGGRAKAETGELTVLVGAADADAAAIEPLLSCFAAQVLHVGACGAGTVAKLVNNQLFLAAAVLVQEAYVVGAAGGIEPSALHRIIRASSAAPYAALAPLLLGRAFGDVIFRLDIATKDLALAVEMAGEHGVEVPTSAAALTVFRRALEAGLGDEVFHATLKQVEHDAGIELPPLTRPPRPS